MVNTEIPTNYTNSPSSFVGTPQWTINRDITALDLDSCNSFEGPEKLLEIWFAPSERALPPSVSQDGPKTGLKVVSQTVWKNMLKLVHCEVLSIIESQHVDAYLLSESSMFVFPHKIVLKTCGTTTLLCGMPRILEIAACDAGFVNVKADLPAGITIAATPYRVFYSRKNFTYPNQQKEMHRSWRDEVRYLDKMFVGGSAYMIGKMNGEHWYLYITGPGSVLTPPATPEEHRFGSFRATPKFKGKELEVAITELLEDEKSDETLEILMTDLDEDNARQFYLEHTNSVVQDNARCEYQALKDAIDRLSVITEGSATHLDDVMSNATVDDILFDISAQTSLDDTAGTGTNVLSEGGLTEGHALGSVVTEICGLSKVYPKSEYPDARIDSYLFTPCGYSANGIVPIPYDADSTGYWTVHVTPEPQCSYASFETNVPTKHTGRATVDVVQQVVGIFKPGRFSVTLFETKNENDELAARKDKRMDHVKGYRRVDRIVHDLDGYELVFRYFEREGWKGGAPRLGERFG